MAELLQTRILEHLKSDRYRPQQPRKLARELDLHGEEQYPAFREALRQLMHEGRVVLGASGSVVLPTQKQSGDEFVGTYRQHRRGFGFVIPQDPTSHEDLFIPPGENGGAITGDVVRAKIVSRSQRDGKAMHSGRIVQVVQRTQRRFVGILSKLAGQWVVLPDGNTLTEPIQTPDAASRHIKAGTQVVVELTAYPDPATTTPARGVITEVLGKPGEKDVDLKSVIIQFNLPGPFPDAARDQASSAVENFDAATQTHNRIDLSDQVICTIDPDDAKDYDDAISLRRLDDGQWELGVHIADVSFFVEPDSPLDQEARARGNSVYFPGYVIPMLPEVLSNGVCSLQEGVPRLCKSAFIVYDAQARPIRAKFANTIIRSATRLRYTEAQALIDGAAKVPHPDGPKKPTDYNPSVVQLLGQMDHLARRIQKRRLAAGQLVLDLPEVQLVLDEEGKITGAVPEDHSFTHTLIEMFMVEANEAVARLLNSLSVPFLRRIHPEPDLSDAQRLNHFVQVAGYRLPKQLNRSALQTLLAAVKGKPEAFAINLAVLRSLTRAEYSPQPVGHFALASEQYCHFTSPIRRYADLTIHRLLDAYLKARQAAGPSRRSRGDLEGVIPERELMELGRNLSFTERRAESAEKELRQVKILELLSGQIGEQFVGVVTGITNFGIFVQHQLYLIDGLIRYEELLDDWWDVDEQAGLIRGQRTGAEIGIGDLVKVTIVRVDPPRRELGLSVAELMSGRGKSTAPSKPTKSKALPRGGGRRRPPTRRGRRS